MEHRSRRQFLRNAAGGALGLMGSSLIGPQFLLNAAENPQRPPNILFAMADDWSWPHASIQGTPEIRTPTFDRIARDGVMFTNAFTAAPQCAPNRAAILTGRNIWQLEEAGTHASIFPNKFPVFTDLLETAGYHFGYTGKGWSPGDWRRGGWKRNPAGRAYNALNRKSVPALGIAPTDYTGNFTAFLNDKPKDAPFCFWFGCHEPHRLYEIRSGQRKGKKNPDAVNLPSFLPDVPETRHDMLDYFYEIEWFDKAVGPNAARAG